MTIQAFTTELLGQTPTMVENKSLVEHQFMLEQLHDKNHLKKRIHEEFEQSELPFAQVMENHGIPRKFGFGLLVQMVLSKRCNIQTLVGSFRYMFEDLDNPSQMAADMAMKCAEVDLVDYSTDSHLFTMRFDISDDVKAELDRFQFPLPMVVPPQPVRSNTQTGYMLSRGSVILRDNHTEDDVYLDHLNRMNAIPLVVNRDVLASIQNSWKNIDKAKPGESPQDFDKRRRAFDKFNRTAQDVIDALTALGETHYITHRYDKRGRTYCVGYHVNPQGNSWNKAITHLAEKEYVT